MIVTVLDAEVLKDNWQKLQAAYTKETTKIPEGIHQTFLIQSQKQPTSWRIITHWRSQKDLDEMRRNETTPPAIRVFQTAKAKPSLEIWDVKNHRAK